MRPVAVLLCAALALPPLTGCARKSAPALTAVSVRLDDLRPLHPAWPQLQDLGRRFADRPGLRARPLTATDLGADDRRIRRPPVLPPVAPPRMMAPVGVPRNQQAAQEAERALASALTERNDRILLRERKLLRKDVDTALSGRKAEFVARERVAYAQAVALSDRAARDRSLKMIALRSQIAMLSGDARAKREADVAALEQTGRQSDQSLRFALASEASRSWQQYMDERDRLEADADRRIELRRAELAAEVQHRVLEYRAGAVRAMDAPAVPVAPDLAVAASPVITAPVSPAAIARRATPTGAPGVAAVPSAGMRSRFLSLIDDDLKRRVLRIAAERRWTPVFHTGRGIPDETTAFREALRMEYARH